MARIAIVTGSDSGIGKATAVALAHAGCDVGITWRSDADGARGTPMTGNEDEDAASIDRPGIPVGRPGDAREIGDAIAWVASEGASYLTGHSLVVDGGLLLMAAVQNQ